jgi:hypothetical protein
VALALVAVAAALAHFAHRDRVSTDDVRLALWSAAFNSSIRVVYGASSNALGNSSASAFPPIESEAQVRAELEALPPATRDCRLCDLYSTLPLGSDRQLARTLALSTLALRNQAVDSAEHLPAPYRDEVELSDTPTHLSMRACFACSHWRDKDPPAPLSGPSPVVEACKQRYPNDPADVCTLLEACAADVARAARGRSVNALSPAPPEILQLAKDPWSATAADVQGSPRSSQPGETLGQATARLCQNPHHPD